MSDWSMGFAIPSSSDPRQISAAASEQHHHRDHGKPRKRRSKLMKLEGCASVASTSKPKYSRKPDLEEPKITRPCSECGKTFRSWKALFGHMRCHPERQWRGINPPPNHRRDAFEAALTGEDHEVAASLLMLANGGILADAPSVSEDQGEGGGGYECSSCRRVFESHQALGGHRASHRNVKGCFAITKSSDREVNHDMVARHKISHHWDTKWEEGEPSMNNGLASLGPRLGHYCGLDLNFPPAHHSDTVSSSASYSSGLTLDLRLGL